MRRKSKKFKFLLVNVGDKIHVSFARFGKELDGIVTQVIPRLGHINNGTTKQSPLVMARDILTGELITFDNSYVKAIIEKYHGPASLPYNYFRENYRVGPGLQTDKKNVVAGSLHALAEFYLARLAIFLPHPIDGHKLLIQYEKQKPGFIKNDDCCSPDDCCFCDDCFFWVKVKPFKKWLKKNAYKIMQTSVNIRMEETSHEMDWEAEHEDTMAEEMKKEIINEIENPRH